MLNQVILIGRLTRDPELRYTPTKGTAVATFTLAVDRPTQGQPSVDFIDIVVWDKQAEACAQYLTKGKLAAVVGRLQIRPYEAKDGTKRKVAEVVAERVRFLSSQGQSQSQNTQPQPTKGTVNMTPEEVQDYMRGDGHIDDDDDEEIPF